jgi:hypothetical protein
MRSSGLELGTAVSRAFFVMQIMAALAGRLVYEAGMCSGVEIDQS